MSFGLSEAEWGRDRSMAEKAGADGALQALPNNGASCARVSLLQSHPLILQLALVLPSRCALPRDPLISGLYQTQKFQMFARVIGRRLKTLMSILAIPL